MTIEYKLPKDVAPEKAPELTSYLNKQEGVKCGYDEESHSLLIVVRDNMPPDLIFLLGSIVGTKETLLNPKIFAA